VVFLYPGVCFLGGGGGARTGLQVQLFVDEWPALQIGGHPLFLLLGRHGGCLLSLPLFHQLVVSSFALSRKGGFFLVIRRSGFFVLRRSVQGEGGSPGCVVEVSVR